MKFCHTITIKKTVSYWQRICKLAHLEIKNYIFQVENYEKPVMSHDLQNCEKVCALFGVCVTTAQIKEMQAGNLFGRRPFFSEG